MTSDRPSGPGFRFSFSSDSMPAGLAPGKKAVLWLDAISNSSIKLDIDCPDRENFFGHCDTVVLGSTVVTWAQANAVRLHRKKKHIAQDNNDSLLLLVRDGGGPVGGSQYGRDVALNTGHGVLLDCKDEQFSHARDGGIALGVYIPRAAFDGTGIDLESHAARSIDMQQSEPLRLLVSYVKALMAGPPIDTPPLAALASAHVGDLLALALGASEEVSHLAKSRGLRAMRLTALRQAIAKNASRQDLNAEVLGKILGLSPRYIQHLLHYEGTTLTEELTARRLDLAFRALSDPARNTQPTSDIAYQCGFGDLSTFYRAFKKRYGMTPGRIRAD